MRIRKIDHIILLFSFISIALFSSPRAQAETIISASAKITRNQASQQSPHTEMELVKQEVTSACHNTIHKKLFILAAIQIEASDHDAVESLFIKNSLLLIKSHLLFNYPFHHFW